MPKKKKPPVPLTPATLVVQKTPNPRTRRAARKPGKTHKLSFCQYVTSLFRINETLPKSRKMTDGEIARQIRAEYSKFSEIVDRFHPDNREILANVFKLRSEYNRGVMSGSIGRPERNEVSLSYDEDGNPINMRFQPPKKMSHEEVEAWRDKYHKPEPAPAPTVKLKK